MDRIVILPEAEGVLPTARQLAQAGYQVYIAAGPEFPDVKGCNVVRSREKGIGARIRDCAGLIPDAEAAHQLIVVTDAAVADAIGLLTARADEAGDKAVFGFARNDNAGWLHRAVTRKLSWLAAGISLPEAHPSVCVLAGKDIGTLCEVREDGSGFALSLLLRLKEKGVPLQCVSVEGCDGRGSARDTLLLLKTIAAYMLASLVSWVVEYSVFIGLGFAGLGASLCHILARICSSVVNFLMNRNTVFHAHGGAGQALGYAALVAVTLLVGSPVIGFLTARGWAPLLAKIPVDFVLAISNYIIQREVIFRKK